MPDYGWAYINLDVLKTIEGPDITGSIAIIKNNTTFSGSKYLAYATASNKVGVGLNFPTVLPAYQLDVSASAGQTTAARFTGDLRVSGSAFVSGTLKVETLSADTVISSSHLIVRDPVIGLGFGDSAGETGSAGDRGFIFGLPTNANQAIIWDQTSGSFVVGKVGAAGPDRSAFDIPTADLGALKVGAISGSRGGYFADRVGIGTASPETLLHIQDGSAGSIAAAAGSVLVLESNEKPRIQFQSPGAYGGTIAFGSPTDNDEGQIDYDHGSDRFLFKTGGNNKMAILGDKVGIGTTNPSGYLHVSSSAAATKGLIISAKGNQSADLFTIQDKTGADAVKVNAAGGLALTAVSASSAVEVGGALTASNSTLFADPTTGRVGVNAALPAAELHVKSPGGNDSLYVDDQRVTIGSTDAQAGLYVNTQNDNMLQVRYNSGGGTELFYVSGSGQVGVGTTSPDSYLQVSGSDPGTKGLQISAKGNQSADLVVVQNKAGTTAVKVDPNGITTLTNLTSSLINLANPATGTIAGPGSFLALNTNKDLVLATPAGGGTPAGSNTQVQFNNGGSFGASADLTFASNTLTVANDVSIADKLIHTGDTDTHLKFDTDKIELIAGNETLLTLTEDTQDIVIVGDGGDVDFQVKTSGGNNTIFAQGSDGKVGMGTGTPSALLHLSQSNTTANNPNNHLLRLEDGNPTTGKPQSAPLMLVTASFAGDGWSEGFVGINTASPQGALHVMSQLDGGNGKHTLIADSGKVGIGTNGINALLHVSSSTADQTPFIINAVQNQSVDIVSITDKTGAASFKISQDGITTLTTLTASVGVSGSIGNFGTLNVNNTAIVGGTINNATIGGTTPAVVNQTAGTVKYRSKNANYNVAADDYIIGISPTGSFVLNLQAASSAGTGRMLVVKDVGGDAGTHNITIEPNGSEKIDGQANLVIAANSGSVMLFCDGSNYFIAGTR